MSSIQPQFSKRKLFAGFKVSSPKTVTPNRKAYLLSPSSEASALADANSAGNDTMAFRIASGKLRTSSDP
ncbi:hypothetical protein Hanom_Chr04g00361791 [Helianthus anomalus]